MDEQIRFLDLPSWYTTEKETWKTIQKLTSHKELVFYLENPDPYIRRLAIRRVGELKHRDSCSLLHGILDDPLETDANRALAGLYMQKLNQELNLGFFVSHPYLSRLTGDEDPEDYEQIRVCDVLPEIRFNFEPALIQSRLELDNELLKSNLDGKDYVFPFSLRDWLRYFTTGLRQSAKEGTARLAKGFASLLINGPKIIGSFLRSCLVRFAALLSKKPELPSKEPAALKTSRKNKPPKEAEIRRIPRARINRPYECRPPLGARIRQLCRRLLSAALIPFRIAYRFKWTILATLCVLWGLFTFTQPGRAFLFRINPKAYVLNTRLAGSLEAALTDFLGQSGTLSTLIDLKPAPGSPSREDGEKHYRKLSVSAPKGLYLRSMPDPKSQKLALMKANTTVEFLSEQMQDATGTVWYKIRLSDGTTGWANAQWLKEE